MKKIIITLICLISLCRFDLAWATVCGGEPDAEWEWNEACVDTGHYNMQVVEKFCGAGSGTAAQQACIAAWGSATQKTSVCSFYGFDCENWTAWYYADNASGEDCEGGIKHYNIPVYFYLYSTCEDCVPGEPAGDDSDEDGIPDEFDPYPEDPSDFDWEIVEEFYDPSTNELVGLLAKMGDGAFQFVGTQDFVDDLNAGNVDDYKENLIICVGASCTKDSSDWADMIDSFSEDPTLDTGGGTLNIYDFDENGEIETQDISGDYDSGQASDSDTDNLALNKIVDNTQVIAGNQLSQGEQLERIAEALEAGLNLDLYLNNSGDGTGDYEGPSAGDIADAIQVNDSELMTEQAGLGDSAGDAITGDYDDFNFNTEIGDPEFDEELDVPEETLFSDMMDTLLSSNPLSPIIGNSGVNLTGGVCSVNFDWNFGEQEHNTTLSLCEYETELETWGTILLSLVGVTCIVMLVRG